MAKELSFGSVQIYDKEILGIGSYGKVCKAKCGQLPCAAKILHETLFHDKDPGTCNIITKFLQECQFLSTIKHPNIVQYLGTATDPQSQRTILLMDGSLTKCLEMSTGPLPYHSQLNICHDVALALAYLHSNDIIHRDLSSNNVLLIGEGSRAKVTDLGMSKLMDMNLQMTPLTQVPGTPAYMPPEALISPPHYSSKLDCFSHGVLTLQIITRNYPNPGDASRYVADSRYPTGRVSMHYPETERRRKDIQLIEPSHPILPITLHCLKDLDTERPSANELCERLASLKREPRYAFSVEQTKGRIQRLQDEIEMKEGELKRERAEHQRATVENEHYCMEHIKKLQEEIKMKDDELEGERAELQRVKEQLQREQLLVRNLQEKVGTLKHGQRDEGTEITSYLEEVVLTAQRGYGAGEQPSSPMKTTWIQGAAAPEGMGSYWGAAVVRGSTAYFSYRHNVYSYILRENKWTKLPAFKYEYFAMAVVNDALTTIGGGDSQRATTNALFSLCKSWWKESWWNEVLPPMRTKRVRPATANTLTYLVVAGGSQSCYGIADAMATVEVLDIKTLQWSTASCLPDAVWYPQITTCGSCLYLANDKNSIFSCSVEDLLESTNSSDCDSVWTRLANIPTQEDSSLATLRGHLLAIGGDDGGYLTGAIHCYDVSTASWGVIGEMSTPRSMALTAVLPSNVLVVVGGQKASGGLCSSTEISSC